MQILRRFNQYRLLTLQGSYYLVLAYKDERLVGYTFYHALEQQSIIHIDHFAVDPNYQGQGIGKMLLESTIKSKTGILAIVLTMRLLNKQAQDFYRH